MPEERNFGIALPGEKCRIPPRPKWTEPERWAWTQICEGRIANFNIRANEELDPINSDHDDKWSDGRILSSRFLETILLYEPFRSAIPRRGVHIFGAYFPNPIDLIDASIERPLMVHKSRFKSQVAMLRLRTPTLISLQGSKFDSDLNMDSISVGGNLFMRRAEFGEVVLRGAKIDGQSDMEGSTFKGKLDMASSSVGVHLFMRDAIFDRSSALKGAEIRDFLDFKSGLPSRASYDMGSASVRRELAVRCGMPHLTRMILRGSNSDGRDPLWSAVHLLPQTSIIAFDISAYWWQPIV